MTCSLEIAGMNIRGAYVEQSEFADAGTIGAMV
jgi:hypothetical protein